MGNPFRFRFPYHGLILIGTGTGVVLCERTGINIIVQKASDGCVSPQPGILAAAISVMDRPVPAGRENPFLIQGGGDFPIGHAGLTHLEYLPHNSGGFPVNDQPVSVLLALAVSVGSVGGKILAAFLLGMKHRLDLAGQVLEMVVIHQTAEVQHIGVVPLAVQAVQNRYEPASEGRENDIRITAHLHKIPA